MPAGVEARCWPKDNTEALMAYALLNSVFAKTRRAAKSVDFKVAGGARWWCCRCAALHSGCNLRRNLRSALGTQGGKCGSVSPGGELDRPRTDVHRREWDSLPPQMSPDYG